LKKHIAIFSKDLLEKVFGKSKTVDIRLSKKAIAPYEQINRNDIILIKEPGGKVQGEALVDNVFFYSHLEPEDVRSLKDKYQNRSKTSDRFWEKKKGANYASIIFFKDIKKYLSPIKFDKSDRSGWKVIDK
jgi:predicted transcriptional regulator